MARFQWRNVAVWGAPRHWGALDKVSNGAPLKGDTSTPGPMAQIIQGGWSLWTLRAVWMVNRMARRKRSAGTVVPSTSDLTTKERALVDLVISAAAEGKRFPSRQELGTAAGYGLGESARVQASRALRRPHVRDAIQAGIRETAGVDVAAAYLTLRNAAAKAPNPFVRADVRRVVRVATGFLQSIVHVVFSCA